MSNDEKGSGTIAPPAQPEKPQERIRIIISVNPANGEMSITGPTHNKLLCAHIMADALKAIMDKPTVNITLPGGHA